MTLWGRIRSSRASGVYFLDADVWDKSFKVTHKIVAEDGRFLLCKLSSPSDIMETIAQGEGPGLPPLRRSDRLGDIDVRQSAGSARAL